MLVREIFLKKSFFFKLNKIRRTAVWQTLEKFDQKVLFVPSTEIIQ